MSCLKLLELRIAGLDFHCGEQNLSRLVATLAGAWYVPRTVRSPSLGSAGECDPTWKYFVSI